jgi:hypothetical protein
LLLNTIVKQANSWIVGGPDYQEEDLVVEE